MRLSFLPKEILTALDNLNINLLSEIRLRNEHPVLVEYMGEYSYLGKFGIVKDRKDAIVAGNVVDVLDSTVDGSVYNYTEQLKNGFITVNHGVRIGIAGEYVVAAGKVVTLKSATSLNIRIPHDIKNLSKGLCDRIFSSGIMSTLIFSRAGLGKTTYLRDIARYCSSRRLNTLVFDERGEIAAMDMYGRGYELGDWVDIVRASDKFSSIQSAIRAMKPSVIITDELYGKDDIEACRYAIDCGIAVIASTHIERREILQELPFEYFVKLTKIACEPIVYDKNFNTCFGDNFDNLDRLYAVEEEKDTRRNLS